MACFLVPTAEAVATTIAKKVLDSQDEADNNENADVNLSDDAKSIIEEKKNPFVSKLGWLNNMLWGGSALLAFEHLWHGEIQPFFPFLTAAGDPESTATMLEEMGTVGVTMAVLVSAVWAGMVVVTNAIEKKTAAQTEAE